jgi:hypothetical protein
MNITAVAITTIICITLITLSAIGADKRRQDKEDK